MNARPLYAEAPNAILGDARTAGPAVLACPASDMHEAAIEAATARIVRFRGYRAVPVDAIEFIKDAVRDSLIVAPQPVTKAWVGYSLTVVGGLVASCYADGVPLEREHVFSRSRLDRHIHVTCAAMATQAQAGYRSRLDVIAACLLNNLKASPWPRATISAYDVTTPYTPTEVSALLAWSQTAHPAMRRNRTQTVIALGLGGGLRRRNLPLVTGTLVRRDQDGVHVTVPATLISNQHDGQYSPERIVTIRSAWEDMVWDAAQAAGRNLLISPTQASLDTSAIDRVVGWVNASCGVPFNIRRLRNTWLVHHLAVGTPLPVLLAASGLQTTAHLQDLLPHVPTAPTADSTVAASALRG